MNKNSIIYFALAALCLIAACAAPKEWRVTKLNSDSTFQASNGRLKATWRIADKDSVWVGKQINVNMPK